MAWMEEEHGVLVLTGMPQIYSVPIGCGGKCCLSDCLQAAFIPQQPGLQKGNDSNFVH